MPHHLKNDYFCKIQYSKLFSWLIFFWLLHHSLGAWGFFLSLFFFFLHLKQSITLIWFIYFLPPLLFLSYSVPGIPRSRFIRTANSCLLKTEGQWGVRRSTWYLGLEGHEKKAGEETSEGYWGELAFEADLLSHPGSLTSRQWQLRPLSCHH